MNRQLHRLYGKTELLKRWFSSRFTQLGKFFLFMLVVGLLFGINVQRTMIFQIFAMAAGILLVSCLMTLRFSTGLRLKRFLPQVCVAGRELRYTLEVANRGARAEKGVFFRESVREPLPDWHEFAASREEGEEKRNIFDRKMGYYRWLWLLKMSKSVEAADHALPVIPADNIQNIEVSLLPGRRGYLYLDGAILGRLDPFGLCRREIFLAEAHKLLVLPRIYRVPQFFFPGWRKFHNSGMTAVRERGDSGEFASLREYSPGDTVKYMDWKSTARTGRPVIRQYLDESCPGYGLILDSYSRQRRSSIFEEAVSLAASLLLPQDGRDSAIDLLFVEDQVITCTAAGGFKSNQCIMEILATVAPCTEKSFAELTSLVRSRIARLSGVMVILVDFDDERRELLDCLRAHAVPMKAVLLVDNLKTFRNRRGNAAPDDSLRIIEAAHVEEQIALL